MYFPHCCCSCLAAAGLAAEVAALKAAADAARAAHEAAAAQLEAKRARLRECDAEIKGLEKARQALLKKAQEAHVEAKRRDTKWVDRASYHVINVHAAVALSMRPAWELLVCLL